MSTQPIPPAGQPEGIWTPPAPFPNPADLGMGRYTNNFKILNMTDPTCQKEWAQVVKWFKDKGAPIAGESFYTALSIDSPYAPTQAVFSDINGESLYFDATICYNYPAQHLHMLKMSWGFGDPTVQEVFPGFEALNEQNADPVGPPLPQYNTPGWTMPFARYSGLSMNFNPAVHVVGYRFERLNGELYERQNVSGASRGGPFGGSVAVPVWQRLR